MKESAFGCTHTKKKQKKPRNARENNLFFFVFVVVFSSFPKERFLCARNLCAFCVSFLILSAQHFFFLFFFSILFFFFLFERKEIFCVSLSHSSLFFFRSFFLSRFQLKQLHEEDEAACHFFKSHFFSPSRNKRDKFYETSSLFFSKVSKETYQRCLFNQCRVLCSGCALDDYLIV